MSTRDDLQSLITELAPIIARDPRVHATIRVGAIGHRHIDDHLREQVASTVEEVLRLIRGAAEAALTRPHLREQFEGELELALVSPFAEGADRLIAEIGIAQNYRLGAILPFAPAEYEKTFDLTDPLVAVSQFRALLDQAALPRGHGILVLDGATAVSQRDDAFLNCAKAVIRWSDIVVAILSEDRRVSQTGLSVQEAIDLGLPVVVIDPAHPKTFAVYIEHEHSKSPDMSKCIEDIISSLLEPAQNTDTRTKPSLRRHAASLYAYRNERIRCDTARPCDFEYLGPYQAQTIAPAWVVQFSGLYKWIENGISWLLGSAQEHKTKVPMWQMPFDKATAAPIVALFLQYHRADVVANAYAELYRSVQIVIVALGIATVVFAGINTSVRFWPPLFAGLELASLSLALSLVWVAQRQAWLERWLNCRLLAEIFRYSKFLMLTGRASPFMDLRKPYTGEDIERAWTRDYSHHVLRAHHLGVPGRGRKLADDAIGQIRHYILSECLNDQIHYHEVTAVRQRKLAQILKTSALVLSIGTMFIVAARFLLKLAYAVHVGVAFGSSSYVVDVTAIMLPAITAAVFALRAYGEHDVIARRCRAMAGDLRKERRFVDKAQNLEELGENVLGVVRLLLWDVDGWLDMFADKQLE